MTHPQQTVLLGITGSIAAYKSAELLRLLQKAGLRVKVVMTKSAQEFIGAATFKALSGQPVAVDLFDQPNAPVHHISLAKEVDVFVIAPCTANVLNKIANGVADDLLSTTALATKAPLLLAPAANSEMLCNPVTEESLKALKARGVCIIDAGSGYLACGDEGAGRLAEPEDIAQAVQDVLATNTSLAGKQLLITAGPTREFLDPVRFISSPSSGLTGYALAEEAARRGAAVTLVSGPVNITAPPEVQTIKVTSAQQMLEAAAKHFAAADIAIFSAAVADFRPAQTAKQKLKKAISVIPPREVRDFVGTPEASEAKQSSQSSQPSQLLPETYNLELTVNPDILATLAANKGQTYVVGFAAETQDVIANAQTKLLTKNADLIVANDVSDPDLGFASRDNKIWLVDAKNVQESAILSKKQLAGLILDTITAKL